MNSPEVTFIRQVRYAGSFAVVGEEINGREYYVRQQLSLMRQSLSSAEPVLLSLTAATITVYYEDSHSVFLCHPLRRISCVTCDSTHCQFAYVARDPSGDSTSRLHYCYVFLTTHPWQTEELNSTTARVFQLAYANRKKKHQNKNDVELCDMEINENQALSGSHTVLERSTSDHTQAENNNRTSVINDLKAVVELRQSSSSKKLSRTDRKIARYSLVEYTKPDYEQQDLPVSENLQPSNQQGNNVNAGTGDIKMHKPEIKNLNNSSSKLLALPDDPNKQNNVKRSNNSQHISTPSAGVGLKKAVLEIPASLMLQERSFGSPVISLKESIDLHFSMMQSTDTNFHMGTFNIGKPSNNWSQSTGPKLANHRWSYFSESNDGRRTPTADANIPSNITRRRMPPANDSNGSTIAKLINYARRRPMSGCYQNSDTQTSSPNYVSTVSNRPNSYDNAGEDLSKALWYHGGMSREVSMELLAQAEVGSFIVRDSTTHPNCYALSVKVPKYDNPSGVCHYLVIPASNGCGYTMKGLDKQWPSLSSLVAHHSIMAELLPCTLRMPQATDLRNAIQAELSPDTQRLAQAMEASNPSHLGEVNKQVATLHI